VLPAAAYWPLRQSAQSAVPSVGLCVPALHALHAPGLALPQPTMAEPAAQL
jgi:hypothetical protein